jgi:hypothetical protein
MRGMSNENEGAPKSPAEWEKLLDWLKRPEARPLLAVCGLLGVLAAALLGGFELGLLSAAAGVLILVIWLLWGSLEKLSGTSTLNLEDALTLAPPSAEEEHKQALLRALNDLEYERSVGKISQQDYSELSARYRAQAKQLIKILDDERTVALERAEQLVLQRGESHSRRPRAKGRARHEGGADTRRADTSRVEKKSEKAKVPTRPCADCSARNDLDSLFCKRCGHKLASDGQRLCGACPAVYEQSLTTCPQCGVSGEVA